MTRYRKLFPNEKLGTGMEEKGSMMNRTIKAAVGMVAIAAMSVGTLAACGGSSSSSDNGKGKVYFLNFKPESSDDGRSWPRITPRKLVLRSRSRPLLPVHTNRL